MKNNGKHLVLSHVYSMPQLKQERVIDLTNSQPLRMLRKCWIWWGSVMYRISIVTKISKHFKNYQFVFLY